MKLNRFQRLTTYEGGQAVYQTPLQEIYRLVLSCMLFEDTFYVAGNDIANRIDELSQRIKTKDLLILTEKAAKEFLLRHVPLYLIKLMLAKPDKPVDFAKRCAKLLHRPDMMTDLLALYWRDGKRPLAHQLKKIFQLAFNEFDGYQLAKYNRPTPIKLRDIMFMCHPKAKQDWQEYIWKDLADQKPLPIPDTWEVALSRGDDKRETFTRLLNEYRLGKLAMLRNMRNMYDAGVDKELVRDRLLHNIKPMLPYQYLAAINACPQWYEIIEEAMLISTRMSNPLQGKTFVMVDVSASMGNGISSKSKMRGIDAASALAIILRERCPDVTLFTFSDHIVQIPPWYQGVALSDAIAKSQPHSWTNLGAALRAIPYNYDRLIVITDEQIQGSMPRMPDKKNYIINVMPYSMGVGSTTEWVTINGFAEATIDYIWELEKLKTSEGQ